MLQVTIGIIFIIFSIFSILIAYIFTKGGVFGSRKNIIIWVSASIASIIFLILSILYFIRVINISISSSVSNITTNYETDEFIKSYSSDRNDMYEINNNQSSAITRNKNNIDATKDYLMFTSAGDTLAMVTNIIFPIQEVDSNNIGITDDTTINLNSNKVYHIKAKFRFWNFSIVDDGYVRYAVTDTLGNNIFTNISYDGIEKDDGTSFGINIIYNTSVYPKDIQIRARLVNGLVDRINTVEESYVIEI